MRLNHQAIKREMESQRWSVKALAKELGIERSAMSSYVTGRRPFPADKFVPLQRILNVNPYMLLGPEDPAVAVSELIAHFGYDADKLDELDVPRHIWCEDKAAA